MSNQCEHPFCVRLISNKCSSHCQLDLCSEHLIEHENLFFVQYEKCFQHLKTSLEQLKQSVNETKINLNANNHFEHRSYLINSTKYFIQKKLQLLNNVKIDQACLYQYDIEQLKLYRTIIEEYQTQDIEMFSPSISSSSSSLTSISSDDSNDEDYHERSNVPHKSQYKFTNYYGQCPLTQLGVYGLNENHNIELCSIDDNNQPNLHLITHLHNHHHIKWSLALQLIDAIKKKSNPRTTLIFAKDMEIIDKRFYVIRCPLVGFNVSRCQMKFYKKSLEQHLLTNHRNLPFEIRQKIVELVQTKGYITFEDFDNDELN